MFLTHLDSPVGELTLTSDGEYITGLWIKNQKYFPADLNAMFCPDIPVFRQTEAWLTAYFSRASLPELPPLKTNGSSFRQAVWALLLEIPYGETTTYGALTDKLRQQGISAAAQAVGGAVGHNPVSILIPCHRVRGANGSLTGYAGGLHVKRYLLELESEKRHR